MFVVMNRISVPAEHAQTFEQLFSASFEQLKQVPGLRRVTLQRPTQPEQPYVSTMEFDDKASFQAWMGSPSFRVSHRVPDGTPREAMGTNSVIETFETVSDLIPNFRNEASWKPDFRAKRVEENTEPGDADFVPVLFRDEVEIGGIGMSC